MVESVAGGAEVVEVRVEEVGGGDVPAKSLPDMYLRLKMHISVNSSFEATLSRGSLRVCNQQSCCLPGTSVVACLFSPLHIQGDPSPGEPGSG